METWDQASLLDKDASEADMDDGDGGSEKICEANLGIADKIAGKWLSSHAKFRH